MIPSVILFVKLLNEQVYHSKAEEFVQNNVRYNGAEVIKETSDHKNQTVDLYLIGNMVPANIIETWKSQMKDIDVLEDAELIVHQGNYQTQDMDLLSSQLKSGILEDLYMKNQTDMEDKDKRIQLLETELSKYRGDGFSFVELSREAKINYENIQEIGYSNLISTNFSKTDTIPTFTVTWNDQLSNDQLTIQQKKFKNWMKVRLKLDTLAVKNVR